MNIKKTFHCILCTSFISFSLPTFAHDDNSSTNSAPDSYAWSGARADSHAPIGVMGDHVHGKGEWMLSYRYMHMDMEGNRDGDSRVSNADVLADYPVAPKKMTMDMHMVGLMYAPHDRLTVMAMMPYQYISMDHVTRMGARFTTDTDGVGDFKLSGLIKVYQKGHHRAHVHVGMGAPTGSIDEKDRTPAGPNQHLPYPMQLGSGTWNFLPGFTYLGQSDHWSWGGQALGTVHLGRNDENYSLGDRLDVSGWIARPLCRNASLSFRLNSLTWGDIDGADDRINSAVVPTADPNRRGGTRVDALAGLNFNFDLGPLKKQRLAVEGGLPVYQYLDGPQLETDWLITAGWQFAW